jgi:hypothetical protein
MGTTIDRFCSSPFFILEKKELPWRVFAFDID